MSVETVDVGVSDKELFSGLLSDEAPAVEQEAPVREQAPEPQQDRSRDEHGRYAKVETKVEPEAIAQEQPVAGTEQPKTDAEAQVPSWRLREMREERQAIATQLEQERQARTGLERQLQHFRAQQKQEPPPDIFADPNAWQQNLTQTMEARIEKIRFDQSEYLARDKHGDQKVDQALQWIGQNAGDAERVRINRSPNPYHEMVKVYDERQTLQQIGGDLSAYRTKVMDEALNDPAFMQKVADKLRGVQPAGQRPVIQMPPSINRATGSGIQSEGLTDADMTSPSLFKHAFSK